MVQAPREYAVRRNLDLQGLIPEISAEGFLKVLLVQMEGVEVRPPARQERDLLEV